MTKARYQQLLEDHDWFYEFTEDRRVFNRGLTERKRLEQLADDNPEFAELFETYAEKMEY